jgi:hypothetical protein
MPWSPKQHRLFEAGAHDPEVAREHGMSQAEARKLAEEGVKKDAARRSGGDTAAENQELATKRPKHAAVGFVDLSPVFNRAGSR